MEKADKNGNSHAGEENFPENGKINEDYVAFGAYDPEDCFSYDAEGELFAYVGDFADQTKDSGEEEVIFLDKDCYLVDGADGAVDFMIADSSIDASLSAMLANGNMNNPQTFNKNHAIPMVRDVEVLLRGDVEEIKYRDDLSRLNIDVDKVGSEGILKLGEGWEKTDNVNENGDFTTHVWIYRSADGGSTVTLETTLAASLETGMAPEIEIAQNLLNNGGV